MLPFGGSCGLQDDKNAIPIKNNDTTPESWLIEFVPSSMPAMLPLPRAALRRVHC